MALEPIAQAVGVAVLYMALIVIGAHALGYGLEWWLDARRAKSRQRRRP